MTHLEIHHIITHSSLTKRDEYSVQNSLHVGGSSDLRTTNLNSLN